MAKQQAITLKVAGKSYQFNIESGKEEAYLLAEREVTNFLAAIKNIPQSYHEAAIVDGAGPVKRFFSITLPMLTPIIFFNLINQVIGAFQAFNSSYLITQGRPLNTTLYYGVHLYNKAFDQFKMGYGCAMAWFMLLVIAFFTALIFRSSSAWVYYESEGK